jgi:hypothetical protein
MSIKDAAHGASVPDTSNLSTVRSSGLLLPLLI